MLLLPNYLLVFFAIGIPVLFEMTKHNPLDRMIGELSYSVYLVHLPRISLLRPHVGKDYLGAAACLSAMAAGLMIYFVVEKPVNRFRERIAQAKPKRVEAAAALDENVPEAAKAGG